MKHLNLTQLSKELLYKQTIRFEVRNRKIIAGKQSPPLVAILGAINIMGVEVPAQLCVSESDAKSLETALKAAESLEL
jgi:hypothetical protein